MSENLAVPAIHLNGTSRKDLHEAWLTAIYSLTRAIGEVEKTAPNMRDFYIYADGKERFWAAQEQHSKRLYTLMEMRQEFEDLILATEKK